LACVLLWMYFPILCYWTSTILQCSEFLIPLLKYHNYTKIHSFI
jgi:hypothetical protein